jgi:copper homeostasis protein CutC
MIFNRAVTQQLNEGPMDFIKGAAAKGMDKLKTVGKNLTTSVTADKLNSAWKKAGSPTDSEEVAKVLTTSGVSADNVKKIYTDLKIPAPGAAAETPAEVDIASLEKMIASLTAKDKKSLEQYITKQLGTA